MPTPAAQFLLDKYDRPLIDLGSKGLDQYAGIYSPDYDESYVGKYIHKQFIEGAQEYVKFYQNQEFFEGLIRRGLRSAGRDDGIETILDIGSGAGNSVIPLLNMFPDATIVASDLSLNLLAILNNLIAKDYEDRSIVLSQLNAEDLQFEENSFDLVVGAAILHHLFHPDQTIECCSRILSSHGIALFFEPMQNANYLVRTFYKLLLKSPRSWLLSPLLRRYIKRRVQFFDDRVVMDKSDPKYLKMDDKWMFPKSYFEDLAERFGFSRCLVEPIGSPDARVETKMRVHMKGYGKSYEHLPNWFREMVAEFDANLPPAMQADIMGDAIIVFVK